MKKYKMMLVSEKSKNIIESIINDCCSKLKQEAEIIEADGVKVSIDIDFHSTGKLCGVKWSAHQFGKTEFIYDTDLK